MKLKRLLAMTVAASLMLTACGSSASTSVSEESASSSSVEDSSDTSSTEENSDDSETESAREFSSAKIAVALNAVNEATLSLQEALDGYIGEALNIEFTYSEAITDAGALTTFIENAYAAGCDAVFTDYSTGIDQAAAVCDELGMYFVGISSSGSEQNQELEHYISVAGEAASGYGAAYAQALNSVLDDGEEHSILILSGAACYGATSFIEGTAGALRALQELYDLTFTEDIDSLAVSAVQTDCENDKGIKITIYPGMADLATNVSPLLQTGEYDVLVGTTEIYSSLGVAVDEVENALGMDIKMITRSSFTDSVETALHSTDSQGSPILDAIVVNGSYCYVSSVIMLRNAIDGYAENMRDGESCSRVEGMIPLVITSAEEYDSLSDENMPFSFITVDEILSLCGSDVTYSDIDEFGAGLTTENIISKFN